MKNIWLKKIISCITLAAFITLNVGQAYAQGLMLPAPGSMVNVSSSFVPPILKGIQVDPKQPFNFDFILDTGSDPAISLPLVGRDQGRGDLKGEALKGEANKLIRYFLAALTIPEKDLWVNLSPYEKDRIIPNEFSQTEMGRDLLAQDYILKQITASLIYPENETGKAFWAKVYAAAYEKYGTTDIPVDTFNKVWIVPNKAVVYENGTKAFVTQATLKVMLETDYEAMVASSDPGSGQKNADRPEPGSGQVSSDTTIAKDIIRSVIIPILEKEVNEGANFDQLRQVYYSLILAKWYKETLKESIINRKYSDQKKMSGVDLAGKGDKQFIYDQYLEAFKKGAFNYVKEEYDTLAQETIPRKYFSGGCDFAEKLVLEKTTDLSLIRKIGQVMRVHGRFMEPVQPSRQGTSLVSRGWQGLSRLGIMMAVMFPLLVMACGKVSPIEQSVKAAIESPGENTIAQVLGLDITSLLKDVEKSPDWRNVDLLNQLYGFGHPQLLAVLNDPKFIRNEKLTDFFIAQGAYLKNEVVQKKGKSKFIGGGWRVVFALGYLNAASQAGEQKASDFLNALREEDQGIFLDVVTSSVFLENTKGLPVIRYHMATAVADHLRRKDLSVTDENISSAIKIIKPLQDEVLARKMFSPETRVILANHRFLDPRAPYWMEKIISRSGIKGDLRIFDEQSGGITGEIDGNVPFLAALAGDGDAEIDAPLTVMAALEGNSEQAYFMNDSLPMSPQEIANALVRRAQKSKSLKNVIFYLNMCEVNGPIADVEGGAIVDGRTGFLQAVAYHLEEGLKSAGISFGADDLPVLIAGSNISFEKTSADENLILALSEPQKQGNVTIRDFISGAAWKVGPNIYPQAPAIIKGAKKGGWIKGGWIKVAGLKNTGLTNEKGEPLYLVDIRDIRGVIDALQQTVGTMDASTDASMVDLNDWTPWQEAQFLAGQSEIYLSADKKRVLKKFSVGQTDGDVITVFRMIKDVARRMKTEYAGRFRIVEPELVRLGSGGYALVSEKIEGESMEDAVRWFNYHGERRNRPSMKDDLEKLEQEGMDFLALVDKMTGGLADRRSGTFDGRPTWANFIVPDEFFDVNGDLMHKEGLTIYCIDLINIGFIMERRLKGVTSQAEKADIKGGIDLNSDRMDLERQGQGADLEWAAGMENISIDGLMPVILSVTPIADFPAFLAGPSVQ